MLHVQLYTADIYCWRITVFMENNLGQSKTHLSLKYVGETFSFIFWCVFCKNMLENRNIYLFVLRSFIWLKKNDLYCCSSYTSKFIIMIIVVVIIGLPTISNLFFFNFFCIHVKHHLFLSVQSINQFSANDQNQWMWRRKWAETNKQVSSGRLGGLCFVMYSDPPWLGCKDCRYQL